MLRSIKNLFTFSKFSLPILIAKIFILPNSGFAGIPLHEPDPLHSRLLELGIQIPVWSWPSPEGRYIRISAHLHNCLEQYEYLAEVLLDELEKEQN